MGAGREYSMSIVNIVGRREEIVRLDRCMEALSAQLIIVYGRRRVGKTYLINEYYNHKEYDMILRNKLEALWASQWQIIMVGADHSNH